MRLDRFITLWIARPFLRLLPRRKERVLPILMYHSISDDPEPGIHPYYKVNTPPHVFRQHMELLQRLGYKGVSLEDGLEWLHAPAGEGREERGEGGGQRAEVGTEARSSKLEAREEGKHFSAYGPSSELRAPSSESAPPAPSSQLPAANRVAITFDDGFRDFLTEAVPVLRKHGFSATMYVPTGYVGKEFKEHQCLSWDEIRLLRQQGFQFGSHTVTHPKLYEFPWSELDGELRRSKADLEDRLGESVSAFAYPYAYPQGDPAFCTKFERLLEELSFQSNVTTIIARAHPNGTSLRLPRLPANAADDQTLLAAKLDGGYDWLGGLQHVSKQLKRLRYKANRRASDAAGKVPSQICEPTRVK